jgi:cytochrome c peroxidase
VTDPADNPSTEAKVTLGRLLFYDPISSVDQKVACATCHSEVWGMSDGLARSVGNGAGLVSGPGRSGPNVTRRNAPTLWNVAFRGAVFWDGRAVSLEDQVHFPFDATEEFDEKIDDVVAAIAAIPEYVRAFEAAFPDQAAPVTAVSYAQAIAAFERSLISKSGLYDSYVGGDRAALDDDMRHGMALFASEGCASCHVPPLFSSERFAARGVPPIDGVADDGRFEVTHDEADRGAFMVPTLRNEHDTGPYFHTGAVQDFGEAVRQEVQFSVEHDGAPALDGADIADITAFIMKGLFDSQGSPTRPREVPSGLPVPIDGFSIRR